MPKLIAILAAMLVGAVVALGLCQALSGREGFILDWTVGRALMEREQKVVAAPRD